MTMNWDPLKFVSSSIHTSSSTALQNLDQLSSGTHRLVYSQASDRRFESSKLWLLLPVAHILPEAPWPASSSRKMEHETIWLSSVISSFPEKDCCSTFPTLHLLTAATNLFLPPPLPPRPFFLRPFSCFSWYLPKGPLPSAQNSLFLIYISSNLPSLSAPLRPHLRCLQLLLT